MSPTILNDLAVWPWAWTWASYHLSHANLCYLSDYSAVYRHTDMRIDCEQSLSSPRLNRHKCIILWLQPKPGKLVVWTLPLPNLFSVLPKMCTFFYLFPPTCWIWRRNDECSQSGIRVVGIRTRRQLIKKLCIWLSLGINLKLLVM